MNQSRDHIAFIVGCVATLCLACVIGSVILSIKGYDSAGAQMVMAVNSGISGLVGFLGRGLISPPKNEINNQGPTNITNQPEAANNQPNN